MPYHMQRNGDQWCVHKGDTGDDQGKVPGGCHPTREKALAHMRALYANVPDARTKAIRLDDQERTVLHADTAAARVRGLGDLEQLTTADGMLFSYEDDVLYPFTASQMKFPVMMAFYDKNGTLLEHYHVEPGVPAVFPKQKYRYVVEMPADKFVAGNLRIGD